MRVNLKVGYTITFATVLLVNLAMMPVSAIDNESKVEGTVENNFSDMPQFDTWAKPQDLSEYNGHKPQVKKEPLSAEALEKMYPYIIALNESEKKEFNSIISKELLLDGNLNGSIKQIQTFDDSKVSVNRTKALEIAAADINSSRTPADVRVVFRGSEAFWAVSYMEGPTVTTVFVDTETGVLYYCLSTVEETSESSFPDVSEFTAGFVLAVLLGIAFFLGSAGRFKK